jgi:hypothetical protein
MEIDGLIDPAVADQAAPPQGGSTGVAPAIPLAPPTPGGGESKAPFPTFTSPAFLAESQAILAAARATTIPAIPPANSDVTLERVNEATIGAQANQPIPGTSSDSTGTGTGPSPVMEIDAGAPKRNAENSSEGSANSKLPRLAP